MGEKIICVNVMLTSTALLTDSTAHADGPAVTTTDGKTNTIIKNKKQINFSRLPILNPLPNKICTITYKPCVAKGQ
ncbi:MAG: hypothetical protein FWC08_08595 [Defluviitaleaceae bacterium]|nr:hypothetical protein [Defluviitaleaceae bacterium]